MTETRIVKIVMVGSLALLAGLVTFDNLTAYENEFGEQGLVDIASDANRMHMWRIVERLIVSEQSASRQNKANELQAAFFGLSRLGHQPIVKRLYAGAPQGALGADHVIGEAGRQAEFERPRQPACGKVVGNRSATAEHDTLAPDCSLDRVIGRQKRRTAVRVDVIDPGAVQPYRPIDSENVM